MKSSAALEVPSLIGGVWSDGAGDVTERYNPARPDELVSVATRATTDDVDRAVSVAAGAAEIWRSMTLAQRGAILSAAATSLEDAAQSVGTELTREEGKTLAEGIGEVQRAAQILRFYAGEGLREIGDLYASPRSRETITVARRPKGIIGVITPWNFPIAIPAWKIAPALVYGNCVVWKPASQVPLLAYRLAESLEQAGMPPGVLSLIIGDGSIGEYIAVHPGVDAVTFTGSTAIGRHLIAQCGATAKPVQAEMGGKNAAIVFDDVPPQEVASMIFSAAMGSTGQKCTATSRLIVQQSVADQILDEFRRLESRWLVGDGTDSSVRMGPAVSSHAKSEILQSVDTAVTEGATIVTGGERYEHGSLAEGAFVPPSVLEVSDSSGKVWREEVFGPVLAVLRVDSTTEALRLANDSPFGLSASVFTNDLSRAFRAAEQLEVGVVHINSETTGAEPHVPFGGIKESGYGPHEQGRSAREFFTDAITVYSRPLDIATQ